jgi:hypothetical protein
MGSEASSRTVQRITFRRLWQAGAVAISAAVISNLLILFIGQSVFHISFSVPAPPGYAHHRRNTWAICR